MNYIEAKELLKNLCSLNGTSGAEFSAAGNASEYLKKYMQVSRDVLGNVIGIKEGNGPAILLDAHLDQIGLVVTAVDDDGFVRVAKIGGSDLRVLTGAEVILHGKSDIYGVISSTPPHLAKDKDSNKVCDFDGIRVDIGMSKEEAERIVAPGDRITFKGVYKELLNNRITSPCIDDRAGITAILRALELLEGKDVCKLIVMFSVQEETGGSGATVGTFKIQPDEAIAVDVSFATAPGISEEKYAALGSGVLIGYSPVLDYEMSKKLTDIAQKNDIPFSFEVMGGRTGTNGDDIQVSGCGVKTSVLSIPIRNMHTAVEVCDLSDIENTARLIAEYIIERSKNNA